MKRSTSSLAAIDGADGDTAVLRRISKALVTVTRRGSSQTSHRARREEAGVDLSFPGLHLLEELSRRGPTRVSDVAEALQMPVPMVSREGNRLIDDGFVARHADAADGRITLLEITPTGRRALETYQLIADRQLAALLATWPKKDVEHFLVLLERFVGAGLSSDDGR